MLNGASTKSPDVRKQEDDRNKDRPSSADREKDKLEYVERRIKELLDWERRISGRKP
jgi:hypothetical protein